MKQHAKLVIKLPNGDIYESDPETAAHFAEVVALAKSVTSDKRNSAWITNNGDTVYFSAKALEGCVVTVKYC